jgi:hypothetical protein
MAYKMQIPFPFNERTFFEGIEKDFVKKDVDTMGLGPDGSAYQIKYQYESGSVILSYHQLQGVVGVVGNEPKEVTSKFKFVSDLLLSEGMAKTEDILFTEVFAQGRIRGDKLPLTSIISTMNHETLASITKIMDGINIVPMNIRVCSENAQTDKTPFRKITNWFELKIEPLVQNPIFYVWEIIYRDVDSSKIQTFCGTIPEKISKIIMDLESKK